MGRIRNRRKNQAIDPNLEEKTKEKQEDEIDKFYRESIKESFYRVLSKAIRKRGEIVVICYGWKDEIDFAVYNEKKRQLIYTEDIGFCVSSSAVYGLVEKMADDLVEGKFVADSHYGKWHNNYEKIYGRNPTEPFWDMNRDNVTRPDDAIWISMWG